MNRIGVRHRAHHDQQCDRPLRRRPSSRGLLDHGRRMSKKYLTPLVLPADPTQLLEAATKQYVDANANNEVYVGPTDPGATYELWVDTST